MAKNICDCGLTHMIGFDGGLKHVKSYLVNDLVVKKEWEIVINPKRNYWPEKDRTNPHYRPQNLDVNETNILEVQIL